MRKLYFKMADDAAAKIEGKPVLLIAPTTREAYVRFLQAAKSVESGLEAIPSVLAELRASGNLSDRAKEGVQVLEDLVKAMTEEEAIMQQFFEESVAIETSYGRGRMQ